jgi:hypothetical protein
LFIICVLFFYRITIISFYNVVLREIFDNFDSDKSGKINSSEFKNVLDKLNIQLSQKAIDQIMKEADPDCEYCLQEKSNLVLLIKNYHLKNSEQRHWF